MQTFAGSQFAICFAKAKDIWLAIVIHGTTLKTLRPSQSFQVCGKHERVERMIHTMLKLSQSLQRDLCFDAFEAIGSVDDFW